MLPENKMTTHRVCVHKSSSWPAFFFFFLLEMTSTEIRISQTTETPTKRGNVVADGPQRTGIRIFKENPEKKKKQKNHESNGSVHGQLLQQRTKQNA